MIFGEITMTDDGKQLLSTFETRLRHLLYLHEVQKQENAELKRQLEETEEAGWKIMAHTFDLHQDPSMNEGNVMTEYEEKFSAMGNPINKYIIYREQ